MITRMLNQVMGDNKLDKNLICFPLQESYNSACMFEQFLYRNEKEKRSEMELLDIDIIKSALDISNTGISK